MKNYDKYLDNHFSFMGLRIKRNLYRLLAFDGIEGPKRLGSLLRSQGWDLTKEQIQMISQY